MANKLIVTAAPHITSPDSTQKIMQRVCIALVPTLIASVFIFGINSLILTAVTVAACVFFEWAYCKLMGREIPVSDFSAVVTGMLLAFNLPATLPWWMAIVGAFIAIVIVKQLFGGLGYNFANPAIVARIALAIGFASRMANYPKPANGIDALASATPLAVSGQLGAGQYVTLLLGNHGGVLGETCAIALIIGFIYLLARRVISATIPVVYVATIAVMSLILGYDPITMILTGGVLLGGIFMLTDYATSPSTEWGKVVFALGAGIITMLIRNSSGGYPEGVSFAILLMNILCPHIDKLGHKKPFGVGGAEK